MTIKRVVLSALTVLTVLLAGASLWQSWQQPQFQSRLELYETNLLLRAAEWQSQDSRGKDLTNARKALLGDKPIETAIEQYQEAKTSTQKNIKKALAQLKQARSLPESAPATPQPESATPPVTETSRSNQKNILQRSLDRLEKLNAEITLRLGLLQAQQGKTAEAVKTWEGLNRAEEQGSRGAEEAITDSRLPTPDSRIEETANALIGLWSNPARLLPDAQQLIQTNLDGWFRDRALLRLYELQQRQDAFAQLQAAQQELAERAIVKLAIIGSLPWLAGMTGLGLLIFLIAQRLRKGKESVLSRNEDTVWVTPWTGEIVWQVFIVGFFLMGQVLIPLALSFLGVKPVGGQIRIQAFYVLVNYLLLATGGLGVLYLSIKSFFPLPEGWFRFNWRSNWILWGFGGYCVALPLVLLVSIINQQLWQGQGGSNPLLSLALEARDSVALSVFFFTAAIAAPLFEEFLFRGFLLPSLTRYMSVWWAIILSAFLFALAHLSLSEILPLMTLGIILGIVYTRSRNLLAPMLLHSLWNSGTLLSLYILGSGAT
ncbi:CPBP family glutamic-type intramembrane protease [Chroococcidiopsis sp.]|uniref:CPBP family intramembrane glutamic endopeptidase n=1 Tax=Chroococcidiopsis sp. TaxID=3088168 RepID=UPI003F2D20FD